MGDIHPVSGEMPNEERAELVAQAVIDFARSNYYGGESFQTVMQDFIGNLGHLFDRPDMVCLFAADISWDNEDIRMFDDVAHDAVRVYGEEYEGEIVR